MKSDLMESWTTHELSDSTCITLTLPNAKEVSGSLEFHLSPAFEPTEYRSVGFLFPPPRHPPFLLPSLLSSPKLLKLLEETYPTLINFGTLPYSFYKNSLNVHTTPQNPSVLLHN